VRGWLTPPSRGDVVVEGSVDATPERRDTDAMKSRAAADPRVPPTEDPEIVEVAPVSTKSLEALALSVGHAVNNPLAVVLTNLDLAADLLRDEAKDPRAKTREALELLSDARLAAERVHGVVLRLTATTFPTQAPPPDREPTLAVAEPVADATSVKLRVLVVDDDTMVGKALRRSLRDYDVVVLDSAKGALARVTAGERFDVLFCDLMMPGMTGMDLHEELVLAAPDQAERMVFITGGAVTTRARDFVATVPNEVLEKPFDVQRLREIVRGRARR
jgi:CheY-like chemotaxis protein